MLYLHHRNDYKSMSKAMTINERLSAVLTLRQKQAGKTDYGMEVESDSHRNSFAPVRDGWRDPQLSSVGKMLAGLGIEIKFVLPGGKEM